MRKIFLTAAVVCSTMFELSAQKSLYIPLEWQNRTDTLIYAESDPENRYTWSKSRSFETENFIIFWDNKYGNTLPTYSESAYSVDIEDLAEKCEGFYDMNVGLLAFCDEANSNVSKYKMMVLVNHSTDWICYGGGYDNTIGALWLSPSTCKPVGHSVAHEVGHSFQYQVFSDINGYSGFRTAIGNGSTFWEQTAQWQANQSYPKLKWEQSWNLFKNTHNFAMTHEWHRYQSYWWHYFLAEKYGIDFVGKLWRFDPQSGVDPNQSLTLLLGIGAEELYKEYFEYAMKCATMDFDVARDEAKPYIGTMRYDFVSLAGNKHQVSYSSCPQSTGFNIIPLNLPSAGTEIVTKFTSLPNASALADGDKKEYFDGDKFTTLSAETYNTNAHYKNRAFRLGYVALLNDGNREYIFEDKLYCVGNDENEELSCSVRCVVPEKTSKLFFVVSPAPAEYIQHKWDENITNDDQWAYTVEFTNSNIYGVADISADREISDAIVEYDVYFPASAGEYVSLSYKLDGSALSSLGTALQIQSSELRNILTEWNVEGASDGKAMFYAVDSSGEIINSGSSANGYGHWFDKSGNRCDYADGYYFSEFDAENLIFTLGQYPGKLTENDATTISQAIKYNRNGKSATVKFVFNIHISASRTECVPTDKKSTKEFSVSSDDATPVAIYSATGLSQKALQRGVNIVRMSDGTTSKFLIKR